MRRKQWRQRCSRGQARACALSAPSSRLLLGHREPDGLQPGALLGPPLGAWHLQVCVSCAFSCMCGVCVPCARSCM